MFRGLIAWGALFPACVPESLTENKTFLEAVITMTFVTCYLRGAGAH